MEFGFTLTGLPADGIVCFDRGRVGGLDVQGTERLRLVVDTFGRNSCRSQGLPAVITDLYRLQTSDHRLYLVMSQKSGRLSVLGGIKTGRKKLFIRAETGSFCEIEPICVLDFYVHEDYQRQGLGKHLFEHFLAEERQTAASVGYDRPSMKLLTFLRKHYGLAHYIPQSNNFVVFSAYFRDTGLLSPADSPWTSVSQRPLTAKKRQLQAAQQGHIHRLHQGNGLASASIAQRQLPGGIADPNSLTAAGITSGRDGHMAASSIPAFRTAANSQLMQRSSRDRKYHAGSDSAGQTVDSRSRHVQPPSAQSQSQYQQRRSPVPEQANLGGPQRGSDTLAQPRNAVNAVQSTRHSEREGSSYAREGLGRGAGALHSVQHQASDPTHSEYPSVPPQGPGGATQWRPEQQRAVATEIDKLCLTAARDPIMTGQAAASATAAQPVMYVKPPWAIDDPYQASRPNQNKHQIWGPPSAPPLSASDSTWSLRAAAGKQRSGAGARDCLMW